MSPEREIGRKALALLADAGEALDGSLDVSQTLRGLAGLVAERMADWCLIVVVGEDGSMDEVVVHHVDPAKADLARRIWAEYPPDATCDVGSAAVIASGQPLLLPQIDDEYLRRMARDERQLELMRSMGMASGIICPLTARGATFGAMTLVREEGRIPFNEAALGLAEALAARAAVAVDNARLYREAEWDRREAARQRDLYETLLDGLGELGEGFAIVEGEKVLYVNAAAARIARRTEAEMYALTTFFELVPPDEHERLAARMAGIYAEERIEPGFELTLLSPTGERIETEVAAKPLRTGDTIQLMVLTRDITERKAAERERAAAGRRDRLLSEAGAILETSLEIEGSLRLVGELLVRELCEVCSIDLLEPDGRLRRLGPGAPSESEVETVRAAQSAGRLRIDSDHPIAEAIRTGAVARLEGITEADLRRITGGSEDYFERMQRLGLRSIVAVPLNAAGRTVGSLSLGWRREGPVLGREDEAIAVAIASRIAFAVENSRLYEERAHVARTLQASLLPAALAEIDGATVAARYSAGVERLEVGGDFYDLFEVAPQAWMVVVGDVCGKGAEAAAMTALTRHTLRALAPEREDPAELLAAMNDALLRQRRDHRFVTATIVRLEGGDDGDFELSVASAGHPPPLLCAADGQGETIGGNGPVLGMLEDATFSSSGARLARGETLVLHTDGLTEVRRPDPITTEELLGVVKESRPSGAAAIGAALESFSEEKATSQRRDDLAVVVVDADGGTS